MRLSMVSNLYLRHVNGISIAVLGLREVIGPRPMTGTSNEVFTRPVTRLWRTSRSRARLSGDARRYATERSSGVPAERRLAHCAQGVERHRHRAANVAHPSWK